MKKILARVNFTSSDPKCTGFGVQLLVSLFSRHF